MKTSGYTHRQRPSGMPFYKYRPFLDTNPIALPDRTWPNNRITKAPRWLSTDLRDGNQALIEPMDMIRKRRIFDLLVKIGVKEIEIGFPAASQTDWDFVRSLAEDGAVPDDVTVSVLTQSRLELIHRTIDALAGFPRATVHLYNATSPVFRDVVFGSSKEAIRELAMAGTREIVAYAEKVLPDDLIFGFEYSPEIFVDTEIDYALEVCSSVMDVWQPDAEREIIINLPTTVERATPNVYADQIEYFSRHIPKREYVALSAHNHNDRGTGVATTELAMLAGIDRVEGCLFGQGERTGNVDLITVAMNLYSQGIDPELDLSDIDAIVDVCEECTGIEVGPRVPYAGSLVYTSFSGSHQDAIKKGMQRRAADLAAAGGDERQVPWALPYLPIDPKDVGRTYDAIVRVNSQSGKGGVAYLMQTTRNLDLPRRMQIELSRIVQTWTERTGEEVSADTLWDIFVDEYLPLSQGYGEQEPAGAAAVEPAGATSATGSAGAAGAAASQSAPGARSTVSTPWGRYRLRALEFTNHSGGVTDISAVVETQADGVQHSLHGSGNGPIHAFVNAMEQLGEYIHVLDYAEHTLSEGTDASAAAYVECEIDDQVLWGCGIHTSTTRAGLKAIISAVNRAHR